MSDRERRRDRHQWWQISAYMEKDEVHEVMGVRVHVRGHVGDLVIVQTPNMKAEHQVEFLKGMRGFLEEMGISDQSIIIPEGIEFLRVERVEGEKLKELEKAHQKKQVAHAMKNKPAKDAAH